MPNNSQCVEKCSNSDYYINRSTQFCVPKEKCTYINRTNIRNNNFNKQIYCESGTD